MITRNRRATLLENVERLSRLPTHPRVVVVDNGSTDGTAAGVRAHFPGVGVIALGRHPGAAGRTVGVRALGTPFVAFADDDSWWASGSLTAAADVLEEHSRSTCAPPAGGAALLSMFSPATPRPACVMSPPGGGGNYATRCGRPGYAEPRTTS